MAMSDCIVEAVLEGKRKKDQTREEKKKREQYLVGGACNGSHSRKFWCRAGLVLVGAQCSIFFAVNFFVWEMILPRPTAPLTALARCNHHSSASRLLFS